MPQHNDEFIMKAQKMLEAIEEVSKQEEEIEKEKQGSIFDNNCKIFGIQVEFTDVEFLQHKAKIRMPKTFSSRSEQEIKEVYFLGQQPQMVFSDGILPFMIAFNHTQNKIENHQIESFSKIAKDIINRIGPKSKIMGEQFFKRDEGNICTLEALMQTLDGIIYNVMFFFSVDGNLCMGSVVFDTKYSKRLTAISKEIVQSLIIISAKEDATDEHN